jgi:hypothetical protein
MDDREIKIRSGRSFGRAPANLRMASVQRDFLWIGNDITTAGVWVGGRKTLRQIADAIYEAQGLTPPEEAP